MSISPINVFWKPYGDVEVNERAAENAARWAVHVHLRTMYTTRWPTSLVFVLALGHFLAAQPDLERERRAMLVGDARGVIQRLKGALDPPPVEALQQARIMETLGEQYHRLSDIDEARTWWERAFALRVKHFGEHSPEAGVGFAYRARYHSYMAASQVDHQREAMIVAERARERLTPGSPGVSGHERLLVMREHAYAHKVVNGPHHAKLDPELDDTRALFHEALHLASTLRDTVWMAQLHHDIGNTYTDLANLLLDYPERLQFVVGRARHQYGRSLSLLDRIGLVPSEASMMEHFTQGLLYRYAFGTDSLEGAIRELDLALLHLAHCGGLPGATDPLQWAPAQANPAQVVELLHYRTEYLHQRFKRTRELAVLDEAIRSSDATLPYWEAMVRDYRSEALYKVVSSYGHYMFRLRTTLLTDRYRQTGDQRDALASLLASERHRNLGMQRKRLRQALAPLPYAEDHPAMESLRPPPGTLVISYNLGAPLTAHVLDQDGITIIDLPELPGELFRGYGYGPSFRVNAFNEGASAFAARAHSHYQALLAPLLEGRTERELVILPDASFGHLPFEALTTTPDGVDWAGLSYLGNSHVIRYAQSLEQALGAPLTIARSQAAAASVTHDTLSALPFAERLIHGFDRWFSSPTLPGQLRSDQLNTLLNGPGLLHIATHANAPDLPDSLPYMVLSNGPFTTADLDEVPVRRQVVVLSTCSSGDGQVYMGAGVLSMGHAFLEAGAGAVVHTLWPVDDRSTSEILALMYEGLDAGLPISKALQQAKMAFIRKHPDDGLSHPFHWAGIIHSGHDIVLARSRPSVALAYQTGLLASALGLLLYRCFSRRRARSAMG